MFQLIYEISLYHVSLKYQGGWYLKSVDEKYLSSMSNLHGAALPILFSF